jgi:WD40 repeat protein
MDRRRMSRWDGARVAEFRHEGQVRRLAWVSQDRIVSVGYDNWVRIWELSTRRQVTAWDTGEYLREVVVSRSGGWLAFGGDNSRATIVDISSLAVRFEMPHPGWVTAMAASKSGKLLSFGCGQWAPADRLAKHGGFRGAASGLQPRWPLR